VPGAVSWIKKFFIGSGPGPDFTFTFGSGSELPYFLNMQFLKPILPLSLPREVLHLSKNTFLTQWIHKMSDNFNKV
jgi:hypothetical protein